MHANARQRAGRWRATLTFSVLLTLGLSATAAAQDPAAGVFSLRCGGCHTIGEGTRVGPDLLGVTERRSREWLTEFIKSPGAMIDRGDAVAKDLLAKANGLRMPDQPLTVDEMKSMLDYLASCSKQGGCKPAAGAVSNIKVASNATAEDIAAGQALFEGNQALANGGASCISCHNTRNVGIFGGGTLAKDLTFVHNRLGDQGVDSVLTTLPFPLMKRVYGNAAITENESYQLRAYLWSQTRDGRQPHGDSRFLFTGVVGLLVALSVMGLIWADRIRGIRQSIVKRGES